MSSLCSVRSSQSRSSQSRSSLARRLSLTLGLALLSLLLGLTVRSGVAHAAPAATWSFVAPLPTAREFLAAATGPDGRIYAIGGITAADASGVVLASVEAYGV